MVISSIPVTLYQGFGFKWAAIPWQPISLVGIVVAFYLGFKNNSSYERLWEARKIWGGIVNASRSFTIWSRDYVTDEFARESVGAKELSEIHKTLIYRHIAWVKVLTFQMRKLKPWEHDSKIYKRTRNATGVFPDGKQMDQGLSF